MRMSRSILYTFVATILSVFYVYQQTHIVKLGYEMTTARKDFDSVMDRKTYLEYMVSSLESPLYLDTALSVQNASFELPGAYRLVKMETAGKVVVGEEVAASESAPRGLRRLALQILFGSHQAEAKPAK